MIKDIKTTGRPDGEKQRLFRERKRLIMSSLEKGFSQSEVAEIFRLPRNTIYLINKQL